MAGQAFILRARDRQGQSASIACTSALTIRELKRRVSAATGTRADRIVLRYKGATLMDERTLHDYEIDAAVCLDILHT